jgi:hypothetical protein
MAEAKPILPLRTAKITIPDRTTLAVVTYSRIASRNKVRELIRRRGDKVGEYSHREIIELGDRYLRQNREAILAEVLTRLWPKPSVDVD